jgi:hypothetical protein
MIHPDDGSSKILWDVDQYLPDYTVQHPRRQQCRVNISLPIILNLTIRHIDTLFLQTILTQFLFDTVNCDTALLRPLDH